MKRKLFAICCLVIVLIGLTIPAHAFLKGLEITAATSAFITKTCPMDKKEYSAYTTVMVNPDEEAEGDGAYVGAEVGVYCKDASIKNVPAGYMGGEPRLYLDGYLLFAEGWTYNTGVGNAFGDYYDTYFVGRNGIVYSKSKFGLYNGDGYDIYDTYRSPSLDVAKISPQANEGIEAEDISQSGLKMNENGQTYGMDCFDDYTPDLIAAIGTNGVLGYIYDADLTSVGLRSSLDEVVTDIPSSIPLYDSDGVTVIGEFPIGHR